jgi:osmotically-inducible protein OsmY
MNLRVRVSGIAMALLSASLIYACNSAPNRPDPKDVVDRDLKAANIQDVNVDYDKDARVLHLKGAVDNSAEKAQAEDIASRAVGTSGKIANELTVKGVNDRTADDMDGAIKRVLDAKVNDDKMLADRTIHFDVNNGVVTITGDVASDNEKHDVGEMAKKTENVKDVVNSLKIDATMRAKAPAHQ